MRCDLCGRIVWEYLDEEEEGYDEYGHETAIEANAEPGSIGSEELWACWDCIDRLILEQVRHAGLNSIHY